LLSVFEARRTVVAGVEQVTAAEQAAAEESRSRKSTIEAAPADGVAGAGHATGAGDVGAGDVGAADATAGGPDYRPRHARRRGKMRWIVAGSLVVVLLAAGAAAAVIARRDADPGGGRATLGEQTAPPAGIAPAPNSEPNTAPDQGDAGGTGGSGGDAAGVPAVECRYDRVPGESAPIVPPTRPTRGGLVPVSIGTNRGPITLELDAGKAPCTVQSFLALAGGGYFTDSACHRVTTALIFVMQCGDPTATGSGGPGYQFADENLPAAAGYPRGTLAMANAGPGTNGGQFFLVYRDSPIDPNYPVFGRVTGGLEILDAVAAGGTSNNDGPPNLELIVESVQVA
jgi:peptidyl-prolyl cis-trans isomerase B (cyclophilin B)